MLLRCCCCCWRRDRCGTSSVVRVMVADTSGIGCWIRSANNALGVASTKPNHLHHRCGCDSVGMWFGKHITPNDPTHGIEREIKSIGGAIDTPPQAYNIGLDCIGVVVVDGGCNALVVWFWFRLAARIGNIARIEASAQRPCKPQSTSQPNPQCNAASRLADQEVDGVWWW